MKRGRETGRRVAIVLNGWDGLTTNTLSFVNLFQDFEDANVTIRVFDIDDCRFYDVDVKAAVSLFAGDLDPEDCGTLPESTAEYYCAIQAISAHKAQMSDEKKALYLRAPPRNVPMPFNGPSRSHPCHHCGEELSSHTSLMVHIFHKHRQPHDACICPYCKKEFTRKDARNVHVKKAVCAENPEYVDGLPPKRADRGSRPVQAVGRQASSDSSFPPYQ